MIKLGEVVMILDLHRQGLSVSAIAEHLGIDRKTVRKYIARGLEPPAYGPRRPRPRCIDPYVSYLRERVEAWPGLSGRRLFRDLKERGYQGGQLSCVLSLYLWSTHDWLAMPRQRFGPDDVLRGRRDGIASTLIPHRACPVRAPKT